MGVAGPRDRRQKGIVRYTHIGEGDYGETEDMIRKLLAEPEVSPRERFGVFIFGAVLAATAILAVLGYVSLRQWEASAELLFREQSRDMVTMAAEKVEMAVLKARKSA